MFWKNRFRFFPRPAAAGGESRGSDCSYRHYDSPLFIRMVNIAANMDPYGNTSGVKVAVANNDKEAVKKDLSINAGKEIIDNLKKNDQLGWEFVSEEKP